jgi:S1-C subfamily serine protease
MGTVSGIAVDRKFFVIMVLVCLAIGASFAFVYLDLKDTINALRADYATVSSRMQQLQNLIESLHQNQVTNLTAVKIYNKTKDSVVLISCRLSDGSRVEGSGFVYQYSNPGGYIVTNNHVVEAAATERATISVSFSNGSTFQANLVGRDIYSDLAVIKVDSLPAQSQPLIIGNSTQLMVGESVYAIGNPFGLSGSMTAGIVSQTGRVLRLGDLGVPEPYGNYAIVDLIQFDAAVNPGNSGGPLLNGLGFVVGVTFAIETAGNVTGFIGIGYAIPSIIINRVVKSLINTGEYHHPWMGITYDPNYVGGLLIRSINDTGPAKDAGLLPDDIIIKVDEVSVIRPEDLLIYLERYKSPGETIQLSVVRNNDFSHQINIALKLGVRP